MGIILCSAVAALFSRLPLSEPSKAMLPLLFLPVILAVAYTFGTAAGILGTISATVVFARVIFHPLGSMRVEALDARGNLALMVMGGVALSYLFTAQVPPDTKNEQPR